jgi:hypothetical protein
LSRPDLHPPGSRVSRVDRGHHPAGVIHGLLLARSGGHLPSTGGGTDLERVLDHLAAAIAAAGTLPP